MKLIILRRGAYLSKKGIKIFLYTNHIAHHCTKFLKSMVLTPKIIMVGMNP